jgi:hypothetical protein
MEELTPVVLFVYNRPQHTEKVLEALQHNDLASRTKLFIYSDGPKAGDSTQNIQAIEKVRAVIRKQKWCNETEIIEQKSNLGLEKSVMFGVGQIIGRYGKVIVLEDDIIPQPSFLTYMNDALYYFQNDTRIMSICSFNFFASAEEVPNFFFMGIADCWGWGTWKRAWDLFEPDARKLLSLIEADSSAKEFNIQDSYPYFDMLKRAADGNVQSWAVKWYGSAFVNNKLSLYPKNSAVQNIGFDGTGVNSRNFIFNAITTENQYSGLEIGKVEKSLKAATEFVRYFNNLNRQSISSRLKTSLKNLFQ